MPANTYRQYVALEDRLTMLVVQGDIEPLRARTIALIAKDGKLDIRDASVIIENVDKAASPRHFSETERRAALNEVEKILQNYC
jgi:hypothetical protein